MSDDVTPVKCIACGYELSPSYAALRQQLESFQKTNEYLHGKVSKQLQRAEQAEAKLERLEAAVQHWERLSLELCYEIEKLPASELQTHISIIASSLHGKIVQALAGEQEQDV